VSKYTEVRNKDRIMETAGNIFQFYCEHCTKKTAVEKNKKKIMSELDEAIGEISEEDNRKEEREKNYRDILKSTTKDAFKDYDKDTWFDEAVSYRPKGETIGTSHVENEFFRKLEFKNSDWFKFQEAVKFNQKLAESILYPFISKLEIPTEIW
jgi:hypothetical protein